MFGSSSQKPGGFSFPGNANTTGNTSTPAFSFGTSNNNAASSNTSMSFGNNNTKPSGFSFGSNTTMQSNPTDFSLKTNTTNPGLSLSNGQSSQTNGISSGVLFGNSQPSNTVSKPSLFGNSSTNPSFGNTASALGIGQNAQQSQNSTFGDFSKLEMPKSLTSAPSIDIKKRRRSSSAGSFKDDRKTPSLPHSIPDTIKSPSKFSIESMRGLFTSRNKTNEKINKETQSKVDSYSLSLGLDVDRIPSAQNEYRRLIIRNPKDKFSKFKEIDANEVLLSKVNGSTSRSFKKNITKTNSISELKPISKRSKVDDRNENEELTFSKPISEQIHDETTLNTSSTNDISYWCSPSIEELSKMTSLELTRVDNFIAGRKNYGHLMFKFPVDLSEFEGQWDKLLGSTIVFNRKTLEVYPEEFTKPSEGNGLNVPAVITLEKVFPSKYDPSNPNSQILEEHIHKLKTTRGMRFISFDPITGNFVFEVQHFSIWGIVDEEEDDPELVERWQKQQEKEYTNEKRRTEVQINTLEKITGYGQPGDNWKKHKSDMAIQAPGSLQFEKENDQECKETERMEESVVIETEEPQTNASVSVINENENENFDDDNAKKLILLSTKIPNIDELVETRAYEPEVKDVDMDFINVKTELSVADNWEDQLRLSNGFFSVFNRNLNQRNSLPLDPQSVGELIFDGEDTAKLPKAIALPPLKFENSQAYQNCLKTEALEAEYVERSNGFPLISFKQGVDLSIPLTSFEGTENFSIWELLAIIYDDRFLCSYLDRSTLKVCESNTQKLTYVLNLKRRELLCFYLQQIISNVNEQTGMDISSAKEHTVDRIFHFICMNNIPDAIQYAINTKNNHLAVLLTILESDDQSVREIAKSQLNEWRNGSSTFVPSGVIKIYKLLSGEILSKEYINHLDGLSWPIVMFLMIKFGDSRMTLHQIISDLVDYSESTGISENAVYKIYFSLFKLISGKSKVLSTFNAELQFLLMKNLKPVLAFSDEQFDDVVKEFAEKLRRAGMIEEALFVLEHIIDENDSERLVTDLLHENVNNLGFLDDNARLKQINQIYRVPVSLLYESRSVEYNKRKEYEKSVCELILAGKLEQAHKLFLEFVAPEKIISGKKSNINNLKSIVKEFTILSDYQIGAGVYGDYLMFIEVSDGLDYKNSDYERKLEVLKESFTDLITNVNSLHEYNSTVKIAKTLMQKELIKVMFKFNLQYDPNFLLRLELPESEKNYLEAKLIKASDDKMLTN